MKTLHLLRSLAVGVILIPGLSFGQVVETGAASLTARLNLMWDHETMVDFSGRVTGMHISNGTTPGVSMLVLADNGGTALVHLGPAWYVDNQPIVFTTGDRVSIRGSKVFLDERSMIIAQTITRDGMMLFLRDEAGRPMWNAWVPSPAFREPLLPGPLEVLTGRVVDVQDVSMSFHGFPSIVLVIDPTIGAPPFVGFQRVPTGPRWFALRQNGFFRPGDSVAVRGVFQDFAGTSRFEPFSITRGNQVFVLQTARGPAWNGLSAVR